MKFAAAWIVFGVATLLAAADDKALVPPATSTMATAQPAAVHASVADANISSSAPPASPVTSAEPIPAAVFVRPHPAETSHQFFDVKNSAGLAAVAASLTGDALSTQKGLGLPDFHEMNPVARPFVQSRSGAAFYNAASFAFMGGGMYLAHKTNHHKLERILPYALASWETFLTFRNYHLISTSRNTH